MSVHIAASVRSWYKRNPHQQPDPISMVVSSYGTLTSGRGQFDLEHETLGKMVITMTPAAFVKLAADMAAQAEKFKQVE